MANNMRPIHPGEILREELTEIGISANAFAAAICVPANRVTAILNGTRSIADTGLRLAKYFGTTAAFWLNLQSAYDLKFAKLSAGKKIEKEVHAYHPGTKNTAHT